MNPALNPREMQARADYIEHLYLSSGRKMAFTPAYIKNASNS